MLSIPRNSEDKAISKCINNTNIGRLILELLEANNTDTKIIKDDKNDRMLQIDILPLGDSGIIIGTLIKIFDITKSYESAQKLKRAEQLASFTTLAAGVAHEIKNPLGSISIYVQLIEKIIKKNMYNDCQCYNEFRDYCNIIKEEISRLEDTINSFLFSVRKLVLNLEDININSLILSTVDFLKYEIENNNIKIDIKFDIENLILKIDEKYIKQCLINIIQNSIDSIIEKKKHNKSDENNISIKLKLLDNYALISIKDTGIGIKEEELSKIFEPYFTTKRNGTGLGLTNVIRIIEAHNGSFNIESKYGFGSEAIIKLPLMLENQKFLESDF